MTPDEHQREFMYQAEKLGIETRDRSMIDIATEIVDHPIDAIRSLEYSGAPCCPSELILEEDWATMRHARHTRTITWLESQLMSSSTYDGSISHLVAKGQERTQLAKVFGAICRAKLKDPQSLLCDDDDIGLVKICQLVTDIGYYGAAVSGLLGGLENSATESWFVLFDIGNPFSEKLEKGRFATHTWDVVSLLGAHDNQLPAECVQGISEWRRMIVGYCYTGRLPYEAWKPTSQSASLIQKDGIKHLDHTQLANSRAQRLLQLAEQEGGEYGFDLLWENVIRFFLKTGNPRYAHEVSDIIQKYG
ncbi:hypothetical protein G7Y79_00007g021630 [Physcia stellaris]|nr:hypothetical protein G7Y79_00007g021630 [Physcia stellaris]